MRLDLVFALTSVALATKDLEAIYMKTREMETAEATKVEVY